MEKSVETDESFFRQVPLPGNGALVLPLEVVPVPVHGPQIFARAPTKAMFRLVPMRENHTRAPSLNGA